MFWENGNKLGTGFRAQASDSFTNQGLHASPAQNLALSKQKLARPEQRRHVNGDCRKVNLEQRLCR